MPLGARLLAYRGRLTVGRQELLRGLTFRGLAPLRSHLLGLLEDPGRVELCGFAHGNRLAQGRFSLPRRIAFGHTQLGRLYGRLGAEVGGVFVGAAALVVRVLLGRLALARRLLLGVLEDLVGFLTGVFGALAALDAVGRPLETLALLGEPVLELGNPFEKARGEVGAVRVGDGDLGGAVAELTSVFLRDVADALGGRERVAPDALGFAHRLAP